MLLRIIMMQVINKLKVEIAEEQWVFVERMVEQMLSTSSENFLIE